MLEYRVIETDETRFSLRANLILFVVCPAENVEKERKKRLINEDSGLQLFVRQGLFVKCDQRPAVGDPEGARGFAPCFGCLGQNGSSCLTQHWVGTTERLCRE